MASDSSLLIPILDEVLLTELGEANIIPLKWNRISDNSYKFFVEIEDSEQVVNVDFTEITNQKQRDYFLPPKWRSLRVWNVTYNVSDNLTALSTVIDIIKDYAMLNRPDSLFIQPMETKYDNGMKKSVYSAFTLKGIRDFGDYGIDTHRDGFIVVRLNK